MDRYIVKKGDSLYSIAKNNNLTVDELKAINNLTTNDLSIGQELILKQENPTTYVVLAGDTLFGIAKQFGTTVDNIKKINNLSDNNIIVGQTLKIVEDSLPTTYVVEKGDSLYSIGKKYGLSVNELIEYNNLGDTVLKIGQVLSIVPGNVVEEEIVKVPIYENYTVKKGDSLYSIANKYDVSVTDIKSWNNLTSNNLSIGQILKIKVGEEYIGVLECFGKNNNEDVKNYVTYTVKSGDNLYSIAKKYDTTVDSIMKLNNLLNTNLNIGQTLKVKEVS